MTLLVTGRLPCQGENVAFGRSSQGRHAVCHGMCLWEGVDQFLMVVGANCLWHCNLCCDFVVIVVDAWVVVVVWKEVQTQAWLL